MMLSKDKCKVRVYRESNGKLTSTPKLVYHALWVQLNDPNNQLRIIRIEFAELEAVLKEEKMKVW